MCRLDKTNFVPLHRCTGHCMFHFLFVLSLFFIFFLQRFFFIFIQCFNVRTATTQWHRLIRVFNGEKSSPVHGWEVETLARCSTVQRTVQSQVSATVHRLMCQWTRPTGSWTHSSHTSDRLNPERRVTVELQRLACASLLIAEKICKSFFL